MSSFTVTSDPEPAAAAKSPSTPTAPGSKLQINAAPWTPNGNSSNSGVAAAATHTSTVGLRQALCPNFMAHGSCMDTNCMYAHTVDELDANGQMNLMVMMSGGQGSPAGGWGTQGGASGWQHQNTRQGYGRHHPNGGGVSSHNTSSIPDDLEDPSSGPSMRRVPGQARGTSTQVSGSNRTTSHNTSGSSINAAPQCPPSPGSHSSEISSVSNASGTDGLTASSHQSNTLQPQQGAPLPSQVPLGAAQGAVGQPAAPGSYGPHTSPFIKSQMYYSQSANKISLPERCRYPHQNPGTYYDYLNVKTSVTRPEIERKYQQWRDDGYKKAMAIDQEKADAMDRLIVDAKNVLCSERMRAEYDAMLPKNSASQPFRDPAVNPSAHCAGSAPGSKVGAIGPGSVGNSTPPGATVGTLPLAPIYSEGGLW